MSREVLLLAVLGFCRLATLEMTEAIVGPTKTSPVATLQEGRTRIHVLSINLLSNLSLVFQTKLAASMSKLCPGCDCLCLTKALLVSRLLIFSRYSSSRTLSGLLVLP